jgi:hypothetical protein
MKAILISLIIHLVITLDYNPPDDGTCVDSIGYILDNEVVDFKAQSKCYKLFVNLEVNTYIVKVTVDNFTNIGYISDTVDCHNDKVNKNMVECKINGSKFFYSPSHNEEQLGGRLLWSADGRVQLAISIFYSAELPVETIKAFDSYLHWLAN